jgi:hypothetical protein
MIYLIPKSHSNLKLKYPPQIVNVILEFLFILMIEYQVFAYFTVAKLSGVNSLYKLIDSSQVKIILFFVFLLIQFVF